MALLIDDLPFRAPLYPFTSIESLADLRIGILTIREKWALGTGKEIAMSSEKVLPDEDVLAKIPANIIPSTKTLGQIRSGGYQPELMEGKELLRPWHIFQYNDWAIRQDFELLTRSRKSENLHPSNVVIKPEMVFVEVGARVQHAILNATNGPIYIGKNAEVMEGCLIRGPFAICENATLKMGAKIYGATTIGKSAIAGGEIKNSVIMDFSNKAHDGYLGDSVLGRWCNLGAGTSNSNLKNTAGNVRVWVHEKRKFEVAGSKCGLLMGDFSRCAVNTTFNTGTVVGICCNIFGSQVPPKHLPDFSWGEEKYDMEKCLADANRWKHLKGQQLTETESKKLKNLFKEKLEQ